MCLEGVQKAVAIDCIIFVHFSNGIVLALQIGGHPEKQPLTLVAHYCQKHSASVSPVEMKAALAPWAMLALWRDSSGRRSVRAQPTPGRPPGCSPHPDRGSL